MGDLVATAAHGRRLRLSRQAREEIAGYVGISPWLVGLLLFTLGPMVYSFYLSFHDADFLTEATFVGLRNYERIFLDPLSLKALRNTAYYAFISVPVHTILAMAVALLLSQEVNFLALWRTIFYLPSVVSGVATAILWVWLFHPYYSPVNGLLGVFGIPGPMWLASETWAMPAFIIMAQWNIGGSMIIFLAGLKGVPESLKEAARIDGAGPVRVFLSITIPMITPTIFFSLVMGLIGSFQMFMQPYVMTQGGPNNATTTVVLLIFRKAFEQFHMGYASALAWLLFLIIMAFTLMIVKSSAVWVYYEGELRH